LPFNTFSTIWGFFEKAMVARSTSLMATHQSWGHSLHCFWGLFLPPFYYGSFKPSSCGGANFSSKEELIFPHICQNTLLSYIIIFQVFSCMSPLKHKGSNCCMITCQSCAFMLDHLLVDKCFANDVE
jgi:hypothetical protein